MNRRTRLSGRAATAILVFLAIADCGGREASWRQASSGFEAVESTRGRPVTALLRDPASARLYAAYGLGRGAFRKASILVSADGGKSWNTADRGLPTGEITTLSWVPEGFLDGSMPTISATLQGKPPYFAYQEALDWRPIEGTIENPLQPPREGEAIEWADLTLQAQIGLPADGDRPAAMMLGTREVGPLISEDGGRTWQVRHQGMTHFDIQDLAISGDSLLAATWFGGIYRSVDRGLHWEPLETSPASRAISSMVVADDGTLWLGLQNGGLLARRRAGDRFERQGGEALDALSVLALDVEGGRVGVGTNAGLAVGRYGEEFRLFAQGLDDSAVSSLLLDALPAMSVRGSESSLLIGTWNGLYRSRGAWPEVRRRVFWGVLFLLLAQFGYFGWKRTKFAQSWELSRRLTAARPEVVPVLMTYELARLHGNPAGAELLEKAADYCARRPSHALFARAIRAQAPVLRRLQDRTIDGGRLAEALTHRLAAIQRMESEVESWDYRRKSELLDSIRHLQARDRLYIDILQADSPAHLKALREPLRDAYRVLDREIRIEGLARRDPDSAEGEGFEELESSRFDAEFFSELLQILDRLEALDRVASAEERGYDLGQALARVLALQDGLASRRKGERRASFGDLIAAAVLDVLRQVVTGALDGLRRRARIDLASKTETLRVDREGAVTLEVRNLGQGHADHVRVELQGGETFACAEPVQEIRKLRRRQSARLNFLLRPYEAGPLRLAFRIVWNDAESRDRRREFVMSVRIESVRERVFRPLRPNPYVVGRPLVVDDPFYGREELFSALTAQLEGARQDNIIVLIGQRRMGKTSVLRRLPELLGDLYVPVMIDLQGVLGEGEAAFFREIATILQEQLRIVGLLVEPLAPDAYQDDPGHAFRREFLPRVLAALDRRRLLLVFDELEVLEERIREGALSPRILPYLRSLMQHESGISFIFAGTHRLDELTQSYWSVFFNLAVYLDIGHLSREESLKLFTEPTKEAFEIDPQALERAYQLTGGHPHFSQLLARELVSLRNQQRVSVLSVEDVHAVAERVAEKGRLHIAYLWEESSADERCFIAAVVETLDAEGFAETATVRKTLSARGCRDVRPNAVFLSLQRKSILRDDGGDIRFQVDLLRRWLLRQGDLWEFCRHA